MITFSCENDLSLYIATANILCYGSHGRKLPRDRHLFDSGFSPPLASIRASHAASDTFDMLCATA